MWDEDAILAEIDRMQALIEPIAGPLDQFIDLIRGFVESRRQKFAEDFAAGPPPWTEPLLELLCAEEAGELFGEFSATWNEVISLFALPGDTLTLEGILFGFDLTIDVPFSFVTAGGGDIQLFLNRALVRVGFALPDRGLFVAQISALPSQVVPGNTILLDDDFGNGLVFIDERGLPIVVGVLADGVLELDDEVASTVPGEKIAGRFNAKALVFAPAPDNCPGDCNRDRTVAINEVITAVNIVQGTAVVDQCFPFDINEDFGGSINEVIASVNSLLQGCPGVVFAF